MRIEPTRQTGIAVSAPADERIASAFTGAGILQRRDQPVRPGALGRTGDGPEIPRTSVTPSNITISGVSSSGTRSRMSASLDIFDGRGLRHDTLVVAARQAVEFLDRHLLKRTR